MILTQRRMYLFYRFPGGDIITAGYVPFHRFLDGDINSANNVFVLTGFLVVILTQRIMYLF